MPQKLRTLTINAPDGPREFVIPRPIHDESVHILRGRAYPIVPFLGPVDTIVDVGANVGASALFFALKYPAATIHSFEPASNALEFLERNTAWCDRVHVHRMGLSDADSTATLHLGTYSSLNNSLMPHAHTSENTEQIQLRHAGDALSELSINRAQIIKVDTEGCEMPVLRALEPHLRSCSVLYLEFHSEEDRRAIDDFLTGFMTLFRGIVLSPHRGNLCYISRTLADTRPEIEGERLAPAS